jgi:2-oxo-3-hexenedioate decarboxylase
MSHAQSLAAAYFEAREIDRLTLQHPISIDEAYALQSQVMDLLYARGEKKVGYKMGLTSRAKMKQMGVDSPIYGVLTDRMQLENGARISMTSPKKLIHPKIEPELAFFISKDIHDPDGKITAAQALEAVSGVCPALEIIDSRYKNFNFTLPDVVADNCSGSFFILGKTVKPPSALDLGNLGMILEVDGKPTQFGSSSAILGHPAESLAELCRMLGRRGAGLKAGQIVLAGAATQAIPMEADTTIRVSVQDLGDASVSFRRAPEYNRS